LPPKKKNSGARRGAVGKDGAAKKNLTPKAAAARGDLGRDYVYGLLREGILPSLPRKPGGRFRIPVDAFDEWLRSVGQKKFA
jgi:excisionase family DNA binding protein